MKNLVLKLSAVSLFLSLSPQVAKAEAAPLKSIVCDGSASEDGTGGTDSGFEFVRKRNGKYKVHFYESNWGGDGTGTDHDSNDPDRDRPFGAFYDGEFTCEFKTTSSNVLKSMTCSLDSHKNCIKVYNGTHGSTDYYMDVQSICEDIFDGYDPTDGCTVQ